MSDISGSEVRVRFAPSPTGALHIGGAHTALFNWLWARHCGGRFILRIEDTDRERSTKEYEQTIMDGLHWLGLDWDEGPDRPGDFGPYRQSERMDLYTRYADELVERGLAYKEGGATLFRVQPGIKLTIDDIIYGRIEIMSDNASVNTDGSIKDIVIIKSDGMPTYNYAVVIDDHLMRCTCVIRGEDHIINTPKQLLIYRALGWDAPEFAHLPMILGTDKKKLSKRHGATSVFEYSDMGYIPDGMFNFLALLGWTPPADSCGEVFSRETASDMFELSKVTRKPAVFDMKKLDHINQEHIKLMPPALRRETIVPFWKEMGLPAEDHPDSYLEECIAVMAGRGKTTKELAEYTDYFLSFDVVTCRYDASEISDGQREKLRGFFSSFVKLPEGSWTIDGMEDFARSWCEEHGASLKEVAMPLRWALTGRKVSPGVFEVAVALGRDECTRRLDHYYKII